MDACLRVTFCTTRTGTPLVVLEDGIGLGAEFTAAALRALAAALLRAADDAENEPKTARTRRMRVYALEEQDTRHGAAGPKRPRPDV
jgi:hypothetical protein